MRNIRFNRLPPVGRLTRYYKVRVGVSRCVYVQIDQIVGTNFAPFRFECFTFREITIKHHYKRCETTQSKGDFTPTPRRRLLAEHYTRTRARARGVVIDDELMQNLGYTRFLDTNRKTAGDEPCGLSFVDNASDTICHISNTHQRSVHSQHCTLVYSRVEMPAASDYVIAAGTSHEARLVFCALQAGKRRSSLRAPNRRELKVNARTHTAHRCELNISCPTDTFL